MSAPEGRRRSASGQRRDALIWGAGLGALAGAVLGDAVGAGAALGAVAGAVLFAPAEVLTTIRRRAGDPKPLALRILASAMLMALLWWLVGLVLEPRPVAVAIATGGLLGLLGLRPLKLALGVLVGAAVA